MTRSYPAFVLAILFGGGQALAAFQPSDLSGLALWLDSSSNVKKAGSVAATNGSEVVEWDDQLAGSNTTAQNALKNGDGNPGPTYVSSGIGGLPSLSYNAVAFTRLEYRTADLLTPGSARTVVIVAQAAGTGGSLFGFRSAPTFDDQFINFGGSVFVYGDTVNGPSNATIPSSEFTTSPIISLLASGGAGTKIGMSLNGTSETVTQTGTVVTETGSTPGYAVGAVTVNATTWNGLISEVLVYDHVLSNSEANSVGDYLSGKYGITFTDTPVPEPAGTALLGIAGMLVAVRRRAA